MSTLPDVVTHRYDPAVGACLNLCALPDGQASAVLAKLRATSRPTLKLDYLERRRATESWLADAARRTLGRAIPHHPAYFFLGDFSFGVDLSRPAALLVPLASVPPDALTFTLGDSMTVAERSDREVHTLAGITSLFAGTEVASRFAFSDRAGLQRRFVEVQVWDVTRLPRPATLVPR